MTARHRAIRLALAAEFWCQRTPFRWADRADQTFRGNGQKIIYVDQENDLLIVMRWIDNGPAFNQFVGQVIKALGKQ